mmetsp:Transcript_18359/g.35781  ORF Transcript_18359/g.35781 Transcript_18359/m.35781 type:complete len:254 (-) Transcript_18359:1534-2295(-)
MIGATSLMRHNMQSNHASLSLRNNTKTGRVIKTKHLMRDHAHAPKVPDIVREAVAGARDEHKVAGDPKPRRHLGNHLGAEGSLYKHKVDNNLGEAPVDNPQILCNCLDHGIGKVVVDIDNLEPLCELVALHVGNSLVEHLEVVVLCKKHNLLALDLVHRKLSHSRKPILEVHRALGHEVEEVLEDANALKHDNGDARHDPEIEQKVDQVTGRKHDVSNQCNQHCRKRREARGPSGADRTPDAAALVLEHHVAD